MSAAPARRLKLVAIVQFVGVALCIPALILPDFLPSWSITASLIGLAVVPAFGLIVARRPFARTPVDLPLGLLLIATGANLLATANRAVTLPHVLKTLAGIALFYAIVGLLRETGWTRLAGWAVCLLGLALVPLVLFGVQWSGTKFSWLPWVPDDVVPRLYHPFWKPEDYGGFNPNMAGGALAMVLPVPLAYALLGRGKGSVWSLGLRLLAGLVTALMGLTLLLTQSRGAMLAVLVAIAAMLAARDWRWFVIAGVLLIAGAAIFQAAGFEASPAWDLTSDADSAINSAAGRVELWSRAWAMAQDFPFTGIGMGMTNEIAPLRYPTFRISVTTSTDHAHSLFFATAAEMGFPGLIGLLAFLIGLLPFAWRSCRRLIRRPGGVASLPLALGTLGSAVAFCVHGLTDDVTFYAKAHIIAWGLFGVAVGVGVLAERRER